MASVDLRNLKKMTQALCSTGHWCRPNAEWQRPSKPRPPGLPLSKREIEQGLRFRVYLTLTHERLSSQSRSLKTMKAAHPIERYLESLYLNRGTLVRFFTQCWLLAKFNIGFFGRHAPSGLQLASLIA